MDITLKDVDIHIKEFAMHYIHVSILTRLIHVYTYMYIILHVFI